jgi:ribosome-binding protein aMBF1 (putative translation factor)
MTMRATTDTAARDAAKRDREELARRESLRVVLDEHTRGSGNTVPMRLAAVVPDYRDAMSRARRQGGAS